MLLPDNLTFVVLMELLGAPFDFRVSINVDGLLFFLLTPWCVFRLQSLFLDSLPEQVFVCHVLLNRNVFVVAVCTSTDFVIQLS